MPVKASANGAHENDHAAAHSRDLHRQVLIHSSPTVFPPFSPFTCLEFRIRHRWLLFQRFFLFFPAIRLIFQLHVFFSTYNHQTFRLPAPRFLPLHEFQIPSLALFDIMIQLRL